MAKFVITRIAEGEKAWSWSYQDGLEIKIKKEPYSKNEILDILKRAQNDPQYEVDKNATLLTMYVDKQKSQQLAWWEMGNDPMEKLLSEFKNADITWLNPEDNPQNVGKDMQNNIGTGESGS